ncbi:MAG TPA: YggT family protein [Thermoanaerobaculia bacterium]|nr:YggT family protein [Thermoanaerobaculia bacterium]
MDFVLIFFRTLDIILSILQWTVLVWMILSWILFFLRNSKFRWRNRQIYHVLEQLNDIFERMTRPFLRPFRRLQRRFESPQRRNRMDFAGIDWSPLLLLLTIYILRQILWAIARRLILPGNPAG